jgi:hypothetical protein
MGDMGGTASGVPKFVQTWFKKGLTAIKTGGNRRPEKRKNGKASETPGVLWLAGRTETGVIWDGR